MDVQRFIHFDEFWTPTLMTIIYVIGALAITLFSLYLLTTVYSASSPYYGGSGSYYGSGSSYYGNSEPSLHFENLIIAVLVFIFGNLYWRVICEIIMVIFKIHEHAASVSDYFKAIKANS